MSEGRTTRDRIDQAMEEMAAAGCVMTISGVAREVGCSPANLHRNYPEVVARIRRLKGEQEQLDAKTGLSKRCGRISRLRNQKRDLRSDLAETQRRLDQSRSKNASLQGCIQELQAQLQQQAEDLEAARQLNQMYLKKLEAARDHVARLTRDACSDLKLI